MAEPVYNLVFRGEVLEGQDRSAVARRLMALLKMDVAQIKSLFSGQPVVLKRRVPKAVAARFQAAFRDAGARLRVAPAEAEAAAPAAKQTLAERLAAEEAVSSSTALTESGPRTVETAGDPAAAPGRPIQQTIAAGVRAGDDWTLSAQGRDLVSADEIARPQPVAVDVSHLSAAPANTGSLEDVLPPPPPPPPVPDTSALELDAPGVDLAPPREVPELVLDLSALSLAETGADLGEGVEVDLPLPVPEPEFDLAPAGADIETLPRKPPPPPPDTSHLEVE
ncbi:MAG: hypothetical protein JJT88_20725 [Gammaproteobacteria bacterium]|nr:hypothetical protein [Gammaproteobacteria bacterium]